MRSQADASVNPLRARLKSDTAKLHERLEGLMALMSPEMTFSRYQTILEAFYHFHVELEKVLRERATQGCGASQFYLEGRVKADLLREDLKRGPQTRESSVNFPWLQSEADVWGLMYVVEGSTLGSQVIIAHLKKEHPEIDGRCDHHYFRGYGAETGRQWQTFLKRLNSQSPDDETRIVTSAQNTFQLLIDHFDDYLQSSRTLRPCHSE